MGKKQTKKRRTVPFWKFTDRHHLRDARTFLSPLCLEEMHACIALQEYTEFQKEKSRFEETVYPMMLLLGSKDPQLLDQVPILFVAEALNRLLVWVLLKTPEATVIPSQYIQRKDIFLFAGPRKVSVLLELASEGLKQQMIEMTRKK